MQIDEHIFLDNFELFLSGWGEARMTVDSATTMKDQGSQRLVQLAAYRSVEAEMPEQFALVRDDAGSDLFHRQPTIRSPIKNLLFIHVGKTKEHQILGYDLGTSE
jgi:hypothetical protein